jgi:hypothetical protein
MVVAGAVLRTEGFRYALDNGAWSCHKRGVPFHDDVFREAVFRLGEDADFIVVPDIVEGGLESLRFSESWLPELESVNQRLLIAVQDGITPTDVKPLIHGATGVFLGGSTSFKLSTMETWGDFCGEMGCWYHVGRVNTRRRIRQAACAGADSFDGTSVTRFAKTIHRLDAERRQRVFRFGRSRAA